MHFTSNERAKLRDVMAAGGLQSTGDMLRLRIDPPSDELKDRWRKFLHRYPDMVAHIARQSCDPRDVVDFSDDVLTVILFPGAHPSAEALEADIVARFSDMLAGLETNGFDGPAGARHSPADAASAEPAEILSAEIGETLGIDDAGRSLTYMRPQFRSSGDGVRYFGASDALLAFDIECANSASQRAFRAMRAGLKSALPTLFAIHINNLRGVSQRRPLLFELRQIPSMLAQRLQPVLVRHDPRLPADSLIEPVGYLKSYFETVWLGAGREETPDRFCWPPRGIGVLVEVGPGETATGKAWLNLARANRAPLVLAPRLRRPDLN